MKQYAIRLIGVICLCCVPSLLFAQVNDTTPQGEDAVPQNEDTTPQGEDAVPQNEDATPQNEDTVDNDSEWYYGNIVTRIEFEGLGSVRENELRAIIEPYIGLPFNDPLLQDIQQRLFALDFFADIAPRAERTIGPNSLNEMRLVFAVVENPLADSIRFEGNARIGNTVLRDTVVVKRNDVVLDSDLRSDIARLEQLYRERGFPNAEISYRIEPVPKRDTRKTIHFDIIERQQAVVSNIVFQGNTVVTNNILIGVMETRSQSLFNNGALNGVALQRDERSIVEYYQSQGYINAEVLDITQREEEGDDESRIFYTVEITIQEGARYTLGSVEFEGNQIYPVEELREQFRMRKGDVLNLGRFDSDFQSVVNLYFDNGYIFNTIRKIESRDEEGNEISFVIDIQERPRAHIEDVIIRGNTKTKDHVILRELPFAPGEVFSASRVRQGVLNLYNLQYFGNILPETPPGSADGLMELILNIEEGQTSDIRLGLAFGGSSEFPVALQVGFSDRNFLGNGHSIGADLTLSFATQQLTLSFTEPWLGNQRLSIRGDLNLSRTAVSGVPQDLDTPIFASNDPNAVPDPYTGAYMFSRTAEHNGITYERADSFPGVPTAEEISSLDLQTDYQLAGGENSAPIPEEYLFNYILWAAQLGVGLGYRFPTPAGLVRLGVNFSTSIQSVEYDDTVFRPFDSLLRDSLNRVSVVNRLTFRASLDSRDLFYNPSSGYYLGQVLTFTGGLLFGDRHYIRSDTRGEIHFTLVDVPVLDNWNFKMVFGVQSLFSAVFPQFFVPSGFRDRAQPVATRQDLLYIDGVFYGRGWPRVLNGEALWDSIAEIKIPILERIVWLDFFLEAAALWTDLGAIDEVDLLSNIRFTFGGGVRFTIPQFPIRLYFAKRFRVVNGQVELQTSSLFNAGNTPGGGIDFVFSIGADLF